MPTTALTLSTLKREALNWRVDSNHLDVFFYQTSDTPWHTISCDDLDAVDTRLVPVLRVLTESHTWADAGRLLRHTVALWSHEHVKLSAIRGLPTQYLMRVRRIHRFTDDDLFFTASVYDTRCIDNNVLYVYRVQNYFLTEPLSWLDACFPGACGRLIAGYGMSLTEKELIGYVFDTGAPAYQPVAAEQLDAALTVEDAA